MSHQPVLLSETLHYLAIRPNGIYIDGTFGRGGHAREILQRLNNQGRLFAFDKDPEAVNAALHDPVFAQDPRFSIEQESFTAIYAKMQQEGLLNQVDGILLDLGVSSPQLDTPERGFSFLREGPLDMRMNPQAELDAATWLAKVSEKELTTVLKTYGEERYAKRIANAIVRERVQEPITTTKQLAEIVAAAHPRWELHKHPATRTFQAIRIVINNELNELQTLLQNCLNVLRVGGRLLVISFHSLEDRIVKDFIQLQATRSDLPPDLPIQHAQLNIRLKRIAAIRASETEIKHNPRARSATLRVMEKLS